MCANADPMDTIVRSNLSCKNTERSTVMYGALMQTCVPSFGRYCQSILVNLIAESQLYEEGLDSEYSSSASSRSSANSSSVSSSDDESLPQASEAILDALGQPYSKHYPNSRGKINKDGTQLHLLPHNYKFN